MSFCFLRSISQKYEPQNPVVQDPYTWKAINMAILSLRWTQHDCVKHVPNNPNPNTNIAEIV